MRCVSKSGGPINFMLVFQAEHNILMLLARLADALFLLP